MGQKERIVSLDLATKKTGIACFENGKYKESYVIDYEKIKDIDERTEKMGRTIISALNYFKPDKVYTEDSFKGQNPKTMKYLSRLHGVAMGWCYMNNAIHHLIYPSTWRKYIPGFPNGRAARRDDQKEYAVQYVRDNYKIEPKTDDEADAILIGEAVVRMNS